MLLADGETMGAHWRADMADVLALLPAVRRSAEGDGVSGACIDATVRAALRSLRAAENVCAFSAPRSEKADVFCISDHTDALLRAVRTLCPTVRLVQRLPAHALWVRADAHLYALCVHNVLHNALSYAAPRCSVSVSLVQRGGMAVLTVRDNGKGMKPHVLRKAFEPWFSCDPYTDGTPPPGLGLGLALVRRCASLYGGAAVAQSVFGAGCGVSFSLPLASAPPTAAQVCEPPLPYAQLAPFCRLPF